MKKVLVVILALGAIVIIAGMLMSGKYAVERQVEINMSNSEVFDYIVLLKNQDNYSVWAQKDPEMHKGAAGTDGKVGFIASWDSKVEDVGAGEQEIIAIAPNSRIDYELRFTRPFEATDNAYMTTEAKGNGSIVKWGFTGEMKFPMNVFLPFMNMEEMLGGALEEGLVNLKTELEK